MESYGLVTLGLPQKSQSKGAQHEYNGQYIGS